MALTNPTIIATNMLKYFALILFATSLFINLQAQTVKFLTFDGIQRKYLEYLPSAPQPNESFPLVIGLHGLGDNIDNFKNIGMHLVGDTARFITLYPEAVPSNMGTAWNSGASYMGFVLNSNINDVGFLLKLIDTTISQYNIDTNRIYICGFSMGGFMANRMACEAGHRITAIASVAGTIGNSLNCNPVRPLPVCHFHGTNDQQVSYTANAYGMNPEDMVLFWINVNQCDSNAVFYALPDLANDNITVETYFYPSPVSNDVMLYKAIGAQHQWLYMPVNDISYTFEIWYFFRKYTKSSNAISEATFEHKKPMCYPNPAKDFIHLLNSDIYISRLVITDIQGRCLYQHENPSSTISVKFLKVGTYFIHLTTSKGKYIQKLVISL